MSKTYSVAKPSMDTPSSYTRSKLPPSQQPAYDYITKFERLYQSLYNADPTTVAIPLPKVKSGDWLADHKETGQGFSTYISSKSRNGCGVDPIKNPILLVAIGDGMDPTQLAQLANYVGAFFQTRCVLAAADVEGPIAKKTIRSRIHPDTRKRQLWAGDCIEYVRKITKKKSDEIKEETGVAIQPSAVMGVTMEDVTKNEEWNFLYGLASAGVGCFSLARFSPAFNDEPVKDEEEEKRVILHRACKVLTHEIGHLFGIKHCIHYKCLMNGVNHVGELRGQRMLECPACFKKLSHSFLWPDPEKRFREIGEAMLAMGFQSEADIVFGGVVPAVQDGLSGVKFFKAVAGVSGNGTSSSSSTGKTTRTTVTSSTTTTTAGGGGGAPKRSASRGITSIRGPATTTSTTATRAHQSTSTTAAVGKVTKVSPNGRASITTGTGKPLAPATTSTRSGNIGSLYRNLE